MDSGLYWCESAAGKRSPERPLSVTDRDLILDAPALPVLAGSDITLRCRVRSTSGLSPVLMKDGAEVQDGPEWNFTVSKEDEGEYSCRDKRGAESERRNLTVTDPPTTNPITSSPITSSPSTSSPSSSTLSSSENVGPGGVSPVLLAALLGLALLGLVLGLVLFFLRRRRLQTESNAESADVTYADITVRKTAAAPPPGRHEEETVYSGVRTQPKGPEEVTYGEVIIKPNDKKRKKRRKQEPDGPYSDPDVVYSSVRTRVSGRGRPGP
ncbi:uncharacterized protein LOC117386389 [Periophthalmus magnuspinnatus]|uniref:uncharacterized protein LOC117386389 n=1 Tax=Periophthalmus magnuspinnatus TaxID=409849 RepID=UPI002436F4F5|nr:uncharacterized protein LOC117386389 [Periophthalmus magnuspinnatus]